MSAAWGAVAEHAEKTYSNVALFDVDCTVEKELCQKEGVRGYPTIKYWVDGKENKYSGGRSEADLKKHVDSSMGATNEEL